MVAGWLESAHSFYYFYSKTSMSDRLAVLSQYLLPKQALTAVMGRLAQARAGDLTTAVIRRFIARYGVNMSEAADSDPAAYASFNEFFTRALKPGVRPLASADWVCPVDGAISQIGAIEGEQIFQAKGHSYSATALVGGDAQLARQFDNGHFATIYLSPRDYHRIHMPCAGRLRRMIYVPGELFSVNPVTARGVPGLLRATSAWSASSIRTTVPWCWCWWGHHRGQHGNGVARHRQSAAARPHPGLALR